jgi:hypothetical protein
MTMPPSPGEGLAAVLVQVSAHAERIAVLDTREADHYREIAVRLRELASEVSSMGSRIDSVGGTAESQAAAVASLDTQVAALAEQIAAIGTAQDDADTSIYRPISPRAGGASPVKNEKTPWRGCAPGSSRSSAPPMAAWPRCSRPAGSTIPCARSCWTG